MTVPTDAQFDRLTEAFAEMANATDEDCEMADDEPLRKLNQGISVAFLDQWLETIGARPEMREQAYAKLRWKPTPEVFDGP